MVDIFFAISQLSKYQPLFISTWVNSIVTRNYCCELGTWVSSVWITSPADPFIHIYKANQVVAVLNNKCTFQSFRISLSSCFCWRGENDIPMLSLPCLFCPFLCLTPWIGQIFIFKNIFCFNACQSLSRERLRLGHNCLTCRYLLPLIVMLSHVRTCQLKNTKNTILFFLAFIFVNNRVRVRIILS